MAEPVFCVYCRRHPMDPRFRPFCSDRCRLLDLGAWLGGRYRAEPTPEAEADDELESDSSTEDEA